MEYVILDIETTGFDLEHSSIIEVGAIIVDEKSVKYRYSSFVAYDGELPESVKRITGITKDMLRGAPPIQVVIDELKSFIDMRPVVSHNGFAFDFPILERVGVRFKEKQDSMELAFFVLPTNLNGHSMGALTEYFGMTEIKHRALADCEMEFAVIQKLLREHGKKSKQKRETLKNLAERVGWWWAVFLPGGSAPIDSISSLVQDYEPYRKEDARQEVVSFQTQSIDLGEVEKQFVPRVGASPDEDYSEDRPEQREMAALIADTFNNRRHVVIEAGTGTGKSKAYLVPSLVFSLKNKIPVIVSTHTKVLQDQLFVKEIPHLKTIIHPEIRVAVLKGKKNYVCLQKFEEFGEDIISELSQRSLYEFTEAGTRFTTKLGYLLITSWIVETERGDWEEIPYWLRERISKKVEDAICNVDELCGAGMCDMFDSKKCFLAKAKLRARDADLVIVNHAIALSGIVIDTEEKEDELVRPDAEATQKAYNHTVFPGEAKFIVFDESHHLEDDATSAWEHVVSESSAQILLQQLYGTRGAKNLVKSIAESKATEHIFKWASNFELGEADIRLLVQTIFTEILPKLLPEQKEHEYSTYCMLDEVPDGTQIKQAFFESVSNLTASLRGVKKVLDLIAEEADSPKVQRILQTRALTVNRILQALDAINSKRKEYVRYIERSGAIIEMKAAPLSVAPYLKQYVYDNFSSVVLTAATLTVNKSFKFFSQRCGTCFVDASKIDYHLLKSSFNYAKQCRFFVPKGISYSGQPEKHFAKSLPFLEQAIIASGGGSLILCSSHKQVDELYERLSRTLASHNIWLLRQSKGVSSSSVIRDFKRDINSVLIGTKTLWQGIDVPGESLRSLFIYKIPYNRPDDPLIKARRTQIDETGRDSFAEYYEPLAALAIKQGFGRLIRKSTDTGIAVFLDEDLIKKHRLLGSLPEGVTALRAEPEEIFAALRELADAVFKSYNFISQPGLE